MEGINQFSSRTVEKYGYTESYCYYKYNADMYVWRPKNKYVPNSIGPKSPKQK